MADFTTNFNTIQFDGASFVVGAETVNVLWRDSDGKIFLASGTTVPTNATAGYAKGAMFFDTDATSTGSVFWVNEGSATSSKFVSVTAPTTITLAGDVTGDSDTNVVASISDTATVATNKKLQFRDTGLYINSSADGQLDIAADTTLKITAPSEIHTGTSNYASTAGTSPNYTLAVAIPALADGVKVGFKCHEASGADDATLNVNSLGAKPMHKQSTGLVITDINDLLAKVQYEAIYSSDLTAGGCWVVQGI